MNQSLQQYATDHTTPESAALRFIVEATTQELQYADMLSGRQVAGVLRLLVQTGGFMNVLEVGMFTGYATLAMAEVLPEDGNITTMEMNTRYQEIAERAFKRAKLAHKITILHGSARDTSKKLTGIYDLIFLDADKQFYPQYYELLKPRLRVGGILVVDNVFWHGGVLELNDRKSQAIHQLNKMLLNATDMETVMLDIRDGLTISRRKR